MQSERKRCENNDNGKDQVVFFMYVILQNKFSFENSSKKGLKCSNGDYIRYVYVVKFLGKNGPLFMFGCHFC